MKLLRFSLSTGVLFLLAGAAQAGWFPLNSGTTNILYSVHFPVDAQRGYAVGYSGTIVKTTDGGGTWRARVRGRPRTFIPCISLWMPRPGILWGITAPS